MLDYKLVNYKSTVTYGGNTYIDLLSTVWQNLSTNAGQYVVVEKWYVARPDLISLAIYGSDDYADIICKMNGISNPFELNEGDIIFCPNVTFLQNCCKAPSGPSDMINSGDDELSQKKMVWQKSKNSKRSPNQQTTGEQNYIIDKSLGLIFY